MIFHAGVVRHFHDKRVGKKSWCMGQCPSLLRGFPGGGKSAGPSRWPPTLRHRRPSLPMRHRAPARGQMRKAALGGSSERGWGSGGREHPNGKPCGYRRQWPKEHLNEAPPPLDSPSAGDRGHLRVPVRRRPTGGGGTYAAARVLGSPPPLPPARRARCSHSLPHPSPPVRSRGPACLFTLPRRRGDPGPPRHDCCLLLCDGNPLCSLCVLLTRAGWPKRGGPAGPVSEKGGSSNSLPLPSGKVWQSPSTAGPPWCQHPCTNAPWRRSAKRGRQQL